MTNIKRQLIRVCAIVGKTKAPVNPIVSKVVWVKLLIWFIHSNQTLGLSAYVAFRNK